MNTELIDKIKNSVVTYKEVVMNFFVPIKKLPQNSTTYINFVKNKNRRIVKTKYAVVETRNRLLTEVHQRLIGAIIHYGEIKEQPDGSVVSIFSEAEILRELKMGNNYHALRETIKFIGDTQYYITIGNLTNRVSIFQDHILENSSSNKIQGVIFHPSYVKIHKSDFSMGNEIFNKLSSISYPTIPSIIKYLIIMDGIEKGKVYELDTVLKEIGFPLESPSSKKEIRKNLKAYADTLKEDYNIIYDEKKKLIRYKRTKAISYNQATTGAMMELNSYINKILVYEGTESRIINITEDDKHHWTVITEEKEFIFTLLLSDLLFLLEKSTHSHI